MESIRAIRVKVRLYGAAAAPADCPDTDQRQFARWVDGNGDGYERCDMGAYEFGGMPTDVGLVEEVRGRAVFPLFIWLIVGVLSIAALLVLHTTGYPSHKKHRLMG
ncbi:MAG: hypothetical protein KJ063_18245 [Anaerolineae bacterium]|nr:hypothetical protein [Anaerolineae bacterium]